MTSLRRCTKPVIKVINRGRRLVAHRPQCRQRSPSAAYLQCEGIVRVFNVEGGTDEWEQAGLPVEHG